MLRLFPLLSHYQALSSILARSRLDKLFQRLSLNIEDSFEWNAPYDWAVFTLQGEWRGKECRMQNARKIILNSKSAF